MFQKEVAERLAAKPGGKDYGRLSVLCQWRCDAKKLFDVNRSAFTPAPKVTSSIVQLLPRRTFDVACEVKDLEKVTAAAFGQRKMLAQACAGRSTRRKSFSLTLASIRNCGPNSSRSMISHVWRKCWGSGSSKQIVIPALVAGTNCQAALASAILQHGSPEQIRR